MGRHKLLSIIVVTAMVALLLSGIAVGYYMARPAAPQGNNESLRVEGVATIKLIGSDGQTVGVWTAHNTLLAGGIDSIAECISGVAVDGNCPIEYTTGGYTVTISSLTNAMLVAIGSCTSVDQDCGLVTAEQTTNTLTPSNCANSGTCTGWISSASFPPADLNCASSCSLNDLAAWTTACTTIPSNPGCQLFVQFDDISGASLPSITITSGETLAVSIQFTVS